MKHPLIQIGGKLQTDYLTEAGAKTISEQVRSYWLKRGYVVRTVASIEHFGDHAKGVFVVRSDMRNGVPVGAKIADIAA